LISAPVLSALHRCGVTGIGEDRHLRWRSQVDDLVELLGLGRSQISSESAFLRLQESDADVFCPHSGKSIPGHFLDRFVSSGCDGCEFGRSFVRTQR